MPPAAQNETADLSIARRSSIRSLNYARENALRPGDSISVREIESKSLMLVIQFPCCELYVRQWPLASISFDIFPAILNVAIH